MNMWISYVTPASTIHAYSTIIIPIIIITTINIIISKSTSYLATNYVIL